MGSEGWVVEVKQACAAALPHATPELSQETDEESDDWDEEVCDPLLWQVRTGTSSWNSTFGHFSNN